MRYKRAVRIVWSRSGVQEGISYVYWLGKGADQSLIHGCHTLWEAVLNPNSVQQKLISGYQNFCSSRPADSLRFQVVIQGSTKFNEEINYTYIVKTTEGQHSEWSVNSKKRKGFSHQKIMLISRSGLVSIIQCKPYDICTKWREEEIWHHQSRIVHFWIDEHDLKTKWTLKISRKSTSL